MGAASPLLLVPPSGRLHASLSMSSPRPLGLGSALDDSQPDGRAALSPPPSPFVSRGFLAFREGSASPKEERF